LLGFHRAIGVVVDDPCTAFGGPRDHHLFDDFLECRRRRPDCTRARHAAQTAEPAQQALACLSCLRAILLAGPEEPVEENDLACANDHVAFAGVVEGIDGNLLEIDVLPHVELCPVRERKDADRLPWADPGVVETPEFRALVLGIPLTELVSKREETL